jgi:hypothetical protein
MSLVMHCAPACAVHTLCVHEAVNGSLPVLCMRCVCMRQLNGSSVVRQWPGQLTADSCHSLLVPPLQAFNFWVVPWHCEQQLLLPLTTRDLQQREASTWMTTQASDLS